MKRTKRSGSQRKSIVVFAEEDESGEAPQITQGNIGESTSNNTSTDQQVTAKPEPAKRRLSVSVNSNKSGKSTSNKNKSTNNQSASKKVETADAVTMTMDEDFLSRHGHHSPLLTSRAGAGGGDSDTQGSAFIKGLMKQQQHQDEQGGAGRQYLNVFGGNNRRNMPPTSGTSSPGGNIPQQVASGEATPIHQNVLTVLDQQQQQQGEKHDDNHSGSGDVLLMSDESGDMMPQMVMSSSGDVAGVGSFALSRRSSAAGAATTSTKRGSVTSLHHQPTPPHLLSAASANQSRLSGRMTSHQLYHQQHGPRRMMRPSEIQDPSIFPKMKIVGVDDDEDDEDAEAKDIISGGGGASRSRSHSPAGGVKPGMDVKAQRAAEEAQKEKQLQKDAQEVDQEDRLLKALQDEQRLRKAVTLPDEVLNLVRKLRSAADIIGSSEGAPPPDALREIAIHSASLARFVSTWTLKQLAEKESHEASLQRQWLSDAARELKSKADNFSWSTAQNSPILNTITQRLAATQQQQSTPSSKKDNGKASNNNNNNNNNNSTSTNHVWPKSYAAITANLGPWILSTLYLIMDSLLHTVQCDRGAIFVPDDSGKIVSCCLVGAGGIARPIRVLRGHGVVGEVFRSGVAVNVLSTESATKRNEEIFTRDVDNTTGFYTRNVLAVPVFSVGEDLVNPENNEKVSGTRAEQVEEENNPTRKNVKALVGRARVVAVVELINKLVPANGEFTPSDELLVAEVGSVIASMLASCGGILQLGTETALQQSAELQAKLLAMRPAAVKARRQFLTATTGGCDSEESTTGRYSFTQVLTLHDEQRARERNIAMQLEERGSAADLSKCGASAEKIQQISRIGGASTKVLRIGGGENGGGDKDLEVERALQDMASFVGRIEAAWAGTRERCVMAEAEAAASRESYLKLEAELLELKRLAHACGIIKINDELLMPGGSVPQHRSVSSMSQNHHHHHQESSPATHHQQKRSASKNENTADDNDNESTLSSSRFGSTVVMTDDQAILERLLHSGDPSDQWQSSKAAFLDFFQSRTSGYKKASAIETMQARNLKIMREKASTSTVGQTMKDLQHTSLADRLLRAGDANALLKSAASTRHRHRMHHNRTIKEKAEVDPLSLSCQKLKDLVSKQENEIADLIAKHQQETKQLYLELLANPQTSGVKEESYFEEPEELLKKIQQQHQHGATSSSKSGAKKKTTTGGGEQNRINNGVDGVGNGANESESVGFRLLAQEFLDQKRVE